VWGSVRGSDGAARSESTDSHNHLLPNPHCRRRQHKTLRLAALELTVRHGDAAATRGAAERAHTDDPAAEGLHRLPEAVQRRRVRAHVQIHPDGQSVPAERYRNYSAEGFGHGSLGGAKQGDCSPVGPSSVLRGTTSFGPKRPKQKESERTSRLRACTDEVASSRVEAEAAHPVDTAAVATIRGLAGYAS